MSKWLCILTLIIVSLPLTSSSAKYRLQNAFPKLTFKRPVWMTQKPGNPSHFFVVEQAGTIRLFENKRKTARAQLFLDIRDRVSDRHNEEGLLGLTFDPLYANNGYFYVLYSAARPRRVVLSRFQSLGHRASRRSELVILEVRQPYGNHNGGTILFGPDAKLYIGLGDGGSGGDPHHHGQDRSSLLGAILRIDVRNAHPGQPYTIPIDNPFVRAAPARPEIWAYGLRNPWRMSFDRNTGALWTGDVGQNAYEEINIIVKGGNYGWRSREGKHPYKPMADSITFIDPVAEYPHSLGQCVVGGYVYRGKKLPHLSGAYLFADYVSGFIGALQKKDEDYRIIKILSQPRNISSLAEDLDGEIYFLAFDGKIYQLVR